jgi:hypothetical protein
MTSIREICSQPDGASPHANCLWPALPVPPPTRSGNSLQVRDRIVDQRTLFTKLVEYPNRI